MVGYGVKRKGRRRENYQSNIQDLGFILISLLGSMSQLEYLEEYVPPSPPRSRPLRLPFIIDRTIHLDDNPQRLTLEGVWEGFCGREARGLTKNSILKFLDLKPRTARKAQKNPDE